MVRKDPIFEARTNVKVSYSYLRLYTPPHLLLHASPAYSTYICTYKRDPNKY
jgi:hypothetical protein